MSKIKKPELKIILASTSPYRKKLLERLGIAFDIVRPNCDEDFFKNKIQNSQELAHRLAFEKALSVQAQPAGSEAVVIGTDQLVSFQGKIFNKPGNKESAQGQLENLSGKSHTLVTAVCILYRDQKWAWANETKMTMRGLGTEEISLYIDRDQPFDCAGSYKIEKLGISLFEKIESTDWTSIEGLPLLQTQQILLTLLGQHAL